MAFELEEFLKIRPGYNGDPGPDMYSLIASLTEAQQREAAAVINKTLGEIHVLRGAAITQIGNIAAKTGPQSR
ncbi:hypothetical protein H7849_09570 [Alloacidobacterium dinghuense]|uniref:Uncharacterized protein n=1 Tax=Alloacidobacterium dinghuense TaxID=2763107 RepID=A0A7G8BNK4_9BACT|nr:hypothetical protein [Alloacidobacterium dinghuense]QNI34124.1 hypothetical protein H7849_09570 [Alloacidobacterium dinghuense]